MKRVLLLIMLLVAVLTGWSQDPILVKDGFQANGSMTIYWESENPQDMTNADEGTKWHLEKQKGVVTFWIDLPDPKLKQLSKTTWKDVALTMTMTDSMKMYVVRGNRVRHLTIAEYEKGKYLVQLCSIYEQ